MSDTKSTTRSAGIGLTGAMFLLFLALRLTGHIDWEWYLVAAPLWLPLAGVLAAFALFVSVALPYDYARWWIRRNGARRRKS